MVWGEHVNNKYLPLQRGGLLRLPVQQDTCWQPDPPQIALMLSNWGLKHTQIGPGEQLCVKTCMQMQPWIYLPAGYVGGARWLMPSDNWLWGSGCFKDPLPSLSLRQRSLDVQVFYSICGPDHPSSRSITLPAAFINDLVSQPALECSRLSRMIDH